MDGGGRRGGGEKENEDLYDHKMFCRIVIPLNEYMWRNPNGIPKYNYMT